MQALLIQIFYSLLNDHTQQLGNSQLKKNLFLGILKTKKKNIPTQVSGQKFVRFQGESYGRTLVCGLTQ